METKRRSLYLEHNGGIESTRALLAFLATGESAGWIFDVIDAAEKAGVNGARELSDAIRRAAGSKR